ncbi:hypothetical protein [Microtetraspora malaysiensis]|uniref:hypothetical protein n=1 Tax=Microtetraspora malaysiensis TaxID=161358 RepID=UPI003D918DFA
MWEQVMIKAGYRCEDTRCPADRRSGGRCITEHGPYVRLIAAPAYPGPDPLRRPNESSGEMVAWCPPCYDQAIKRARKVERDRMRMEAADADTLF